ncbi:MAG: CHAD domain-containing protein [Nocardioides sp.]
MPDLSRPAADASVAAALGPSLRTQVEVLRAWEAELWLANPVAVHRYRVAARRLRSTLSAFAPFFDAAPVSIARELRRAGAPFSAARDAQAMRERVVALLARLEPDEANAGVTERLLGALDGSVVTGTDAGMTYLATPAYDGLVRRLEAFADVPPWSAAASEPHDVALRGLMAQEWARFRQTALRPLSRPADWDDEERMHDARKAAKRARPGERLGRGRRARPADRPADRPARDPRGDRRRGDGP